MAHLHFKIKNQTELNLCKNHGYGTNHCRYPRCPFIHVCRSWLAGFCGEQSCNFEHSFDKSLKILAKADTKLTSQVSCDENRREIVAACFPLTCSMYNVVGKSCKFGVKCQYLHICASHVLCECKPEQCLNGLSHNFHDDHNRSVLASFNINCSMPEENIRNSVLVKRRGQPSGPRCSCGTAGRDDSDNESVCSNVSQESSHSSHRGGRGQRGRGRGERGHGPPQRGREGCGQFHGNAGRGQHHQSMGDVRPLIYFGSDAADSAHVYSQRGHGPDHRGHYPVQRGHDPVQRGPDPVQRGHDPVQRGHGPDHRGHDPVQRGYGPDHRGHDPVQRGYDPVQRGHDPVQRGHGPVQRGHGPVQRGNGPVQRGYSPVHRGHDPVQRGHDPVQRGHGPVQRGHGPVQRGHGPVQRGYSPVHRGHCLRNRYPAPLVQDPSESSEDNHGYRVYPAPLAQDPSESSEDNSQDSDESTDDNNSLGKEAVSAKKKKRRPRRHKKGSTSGKQDQFSVVPSPMAIVVGVSVPEKELKQWNIDPVNIENVQSTPDDQDREEDEGFVNIVKQFLIQSGGWSTVEQLQANKAVQCSVPGDFDFQTWFRMKTKHFMSHYGASGKLVKVTLFCPSLRLCFNYNSPKGCEDEACKRLHVCKGYIAGVCVDEKSCHLKLAHNFQSGSVRKHLTDVGLHKAKKAALTNIFAFSVPTVCMAFNESICTKQTNCLDLHICRNWILDRCSSGDKCNLLHSFDGEEVGRVLARYHLSSKLSVFVLKRMIMPGCSSSDDKAPEDLRAQPQSPDPGADIMTAQASKSTPSQKEGRRPSGTDVTGPKKVIKKPQGKAQPQLDLGLERICEGHIRDLCTSDKCPRVHHELPHMWMFQRVENVEKWECLNADVSMKIEEVYCDVSKDCWTGTSVKIAPSIKKKAQAMVQFDTMKLRVQDDSGQSQMFPLERLSTLSYIKATPMMTWAMQWKWYYQMESGNWKSAEQEENKRHMDELELNFSEGKEEFSFDSYVVYFKTMHLVHMSTGKQCSVRRRPAKFIQRSDILDSIGEKKGSVPKLLSQSEQDLPSHWEAMGPQPCKMIKLSNSDDEFKKVEETFRHNLKENEATIMSIERIQNAQLYQSWTQTLLSITASNGGSCTKEQLLHGCDSNMVDHICQNNFVSQSPQLTGCLPQGMGSGIFFTPDAGLAHTMAPDTQYGVCHMFVANIAYANAIIGTQNVSHFDVAVDDHLPSWYLLKKNSQCFPAYLIKYMNEGIASGASASALPEKSAIEDLKGLDLGGPSVSPPVMYPLGQQSPFSVPPPSIHSVAPPSLHQLHSMPVAPPPYSTLPPQGSFSIPTFSRSQTQAIPPAMAPDHTNEITPPSINPLVPPILAYPTDVSRVLHYPHPQDPTNTITYPNEPSTIPKKQKKDDCILQ